MCAYVRGDTRRETRISSSESGHAPAVRQGACREWPIKARVTYGRASAATIRAAPTSVIYIARVAALLRFAAPPTAPRDFSFSMPESSPESVGARSCALGFYFILHNQVVFEAVFVDKVIELFKVFSLAKRWARFPQCAKPPSKILKRVGSKILSNLHLPTSIMFSEELKKKFDELFVSHTIPWNNIKRSVLRSATLAAFFSKRHFLVYIRLTRFNVRSVYKTKT